jgi:hypothetical protein
MGERWRGVRIWGMEEWVGFAENMHVDEEGDVMESGKKA